VTKTFFRSGTVVKIGDTIAIIIADGESLPYGKPPSSLEIVRVLREKPSK
jgi:hypothetical protein